MNQNKNLSRKGELFRITEVILSLFRGKDSHTREEIYRVVYSEVMSDNAVSWYKWDMIRKVIHNLRKYSTLFLIPRYYGGTWVYTIPKTYDDIKPFVNQCDDIIQGVKNTQKRAYRAIKEQWHRREITFSKKMISNMD